MVSLGNATLEFLMDFSMAATVRSTKSSVYFRTRTRALFIKEIRNGRFFDRNIPILIVLMRFQSIPTDLVARRDFWNPALSHFQILAPDFLSISVQKYYDISNVSIVRKLKIENPKKGKRPISSRRNKKKYESVYRSRTASLGPMHGKLDDSDSKNRSGVRTG